MFDVLHFAILPIIEEGIGAGGPGGQLPLFETGSGGNVSVNNTRTAFQNQKFGVQILVFFFGQYNLFRTSLNLK